MVFTRGSLGVERQAQEEPVGQTRLADRVALMLSRVRGWWRLGGEGEHPDSCVFGFLAPFFLVFFLVFWRLCSLLFGPHNPFWLPRTQRALGQNISATL
jgi:hypothetical protein